MYFVLLFLMAAIFGFSFIVMESAVKGDIPTFFLLAVRFAIGALAIFITSLFFKSDAKSGTGTSGTHCYLKGIIIGALGFAAFSLQTYALNYTTSANNGMITGAYVIILPFIYTISNRKLRLKPFVDGIVCLVGLAMIFDIFKSDISFNIGDLMTLGCAFFFAVQFYYIEKFVRDADVLKMTYTQLATISAFSLLFSLLTEIQKYGSIDVKSFVLPVLYLGIIGTSVTYLIQMAAQKHIKATAVSLISCLESVFALLFSILFGRTDITFMLIAGSVLMLTSIVSSILLTKTPAPTNDRQPL